MTENTSTKPTPAPQSWEPTKGQRIAAAIHSVFSFRAVFAGFFLAALLATLIGVPVLIYVFYPIIAYISAYSGWSTGTFLGTGRRVYGLLNMEPKAVWQAREAYEQSLPPEEPYPYGNRYDR